MSAARSLKPTPKLSRRRLLMAGGAGLAAVALGGAWSSNDLRIERHTLRLPRWKADGFRVVQISDVHVNNSGLLARAEQAVRIAVKERPDLIVFTGDFLNVASEQTLQNVVQAFRPLDDADCPCYAVFGNHDYWCRCVPQLLEAVRETRLKVLRNDVVDLGDVTLAGLDDAFEGHARPDVIRRDRHSESLLVLLHEPDYVKDVPEIASLTLSGHSHGGEICLPGGFPLHTPRGARTYTKGFYPDAHVPLYVSRGVATLGPCRIYCPPEVSVLTLEPA